MLYPGIHLNLDLCCSESASKILHPKRAGAITRVRLKPAGRVFILPGLLSLINLMWGEARLRLGLDGTLSIDPFPEMGEAAVDVGLPRGLHSPYFTAELMNRPVLHESAIQSALWTQAARQVQSNFLRVPPGSVDEQQPFFVQRILTSLLVHPTVQRDLARSVSLLSTRGPAANRARRAIKRSLEQTFDYLNGLHSIKQEQQPSTYEDATKSQTLSTGDRTTPVMRRRPSFDLPTYKHEPETKRSKKGGNSNASV